jgi:tetratricopeptide (TPR) repeat protein
MTNFLDVALGKAEAHLGKGEIDDAEKVFRSVLAVFPESKRAVEGLQKVQHIFDAKTPKKLIPPQDKIQEIIGLYNQGLFLEVIQKAEEMTHSFTPNAMLFNLVAAANSGLKNLDLAIANFQKVLEINPKDFMAWFNIGNIYKEKEDYDSEIESYKKALLIKPDHVQSYNNMGRALKAKGDLTAAIEQFTEALNIKPDFAEAHFNLGIALHETGDLDGSIKSYQQACKIKPDYIKAHFNMGNALKDCGDLDAAIKSYEKAIEIKPEYTEAFINMGNALSEKGKPDAAIESYQEAFEINPEFTESALNYIKPKLIISETEVLSLWEAGQK